ncbi:MAG: ABC transporter permease [Bdellovibrionaceae bacterium]|nr:ABC transporter permease [Pseudobdellovibrionaceae bacterium]MBX3035019.1 ABC transporter permease [Pseudobdellovibrionaceae bacterium]
MKAIVTLALTSYREMIRERVVLVIAALALFLVFLSLLLGQFTFDESERLLADLGWAATELGAVAVALFSGSFLLARELDRQTCLLILSKPVSRTQFLIGKWAGTFLLLLSLVLVMSLTMAALLGRFSAPLWIIAASILCKSLILLSWALFASTLVRPTLALLSGVCLYLLGHWLGDLTYFAEKSADPAAVEIMRAARWLVPNFDLFNWKDHFHLVNPPSSRDIIGMCLQGAAWVVIWLAAAGAVFRRKDLV